MVNEIILGTFSFQGRHFSATLSMQDDEGNAIAFDQAIQTETLLKLYRDTIEKMLKEHEADPTLKTPEYINEDGVKYSEGFKEHQSPELQDRWDVLFAAQADRVRFQKISGETDHLKAIRRVVDKFQNKVPFDALDKLVLRYEEGKSHNYRDPEIVKSRINIFLERIDP